MFYDDRDLSSGEACTYKRERLIVKETTPKVETRQEFLSTLSDRYQRNVIYTTEVKKGRFFHVNQGVVHLLFVCDYLVKVLPFLYISFTYTYCFVDPVKGQ